MFLDISQKLNWIVQFWKDIIVLTLTNVPKKKFSVWSSKISAEALALDNQNPCLQISC